MMIWLRFSKIGIPPFAGFFAKFYIFVSAIETGFYYIALKAKVPILMVGFCFKRRIVHFGEKFYPSGNIDKDMKKIISFFSNY